MNRLTIITTAALLCISYVQAQGQDCASKGGNCVAKKGKPTPPANCDPFPYKCSQGQICCKPTSDKVGAEARRKCGKTTKKCLREGGSCVPTRNYNCSTFAVDSMCKGASCTCCVSELQTCNPLPGCRFRNGFCTRKTLSAQCPGTFDSSLCGSAKCGCCLKEGSCNCGVANEVRIVGGVEVAPPHKYPWMAGLRSDFFDSNYCGGSVINNRYILTAAHCVHHPSTGKVLKPKDIQVSLGDHNQNSTADDVPGATRTVGIEEIIVNENYDATTVDNDIALLKLKEPLDLTASDAIKPVCLPLNADNTYEGEDGVVAGWGLQDYQDTSSVPDTLYEVTLPILSQDCPGKENLILDVTDNMLCAGYKKGAKDACKGDSGGPFVVNDGTKYTLVGIVSFGQGCAEPNTPGVYTRVTRYLDWIMANTADATYCS